MSQDLTDSDSNEHSNSVVISPMGSIHWGKDEDDSSQGVTYQPRKQEEERIKRLTTRERVINELITTERDFVV
jgi:hypothetical protein